MSAVAACHYRALPNHARFVMGAISEPETRDNPVAAGDASSRFKYRILPYQFVLQDHNYGAPPPPTPPQSPPPPAEDDPAPDEDTNTSAVTSSTDEEDTVEQSITRCICEFDHDDEYMICCDRCSVWQHVACMGLDRESIPETYLCERCQPRRVDRHKAKVLQNKKRRKLTKCGSEESGDGPQCRNNNGNGKTATSPVRHAANGTSATPAANLPGAGRSALKRKRKDAAVRTMDATCPKTVAAVRGSAAPTARRRKLREKENRKVVPRKKMKRKSVEMNLIDEDARDSWESSLREWIDKYEDAMVNQYSPELLSYVPKLRVNGVREESVRQTVENLRAQRCRVAQVAKSCKGLVASEDLGGDQVICECRGKMQLLSQTPLSGSRPVPFVMVYSVQKEHESVCVDARNFGNDARFIRRSCAPNAEVKHVWDNGNLRLYLAACKAIRKDEEITIPFDTKPEEGEERVQCACTREDCGTVLGTKRNWLAEMSVEGKKRTKRPSATEDDTGSRSDACEETQAVPANCKTTASTSPGNGVESAEGLLSPDTSFAKGDDDSHTAADKKKMTREERKMEAIMKAFARLEKAEQRRQEAMTRMAQKKDDGQQRRRSSGECPNDKPDQTPVVQAPPPLPPPPPPPPPPEPEQATVANTESAATPTTEPTTELPVVPEPPEPIPVEAPTPAIVTQPPQRHRLKGRRRRRSSGTPARRQTRTQSGGSSEVPSADETSQPQVTAATVAVVVAALPSPPTQAPPEPEVEVPVAPTGPITMMGLSKRLLKTKKHMMNEWLSGESNDVVGGNQSANLNLNLKLEISVPPLDPCAAASPTCYVRCSRSPSGISTAHLRRASVGESGSKCKGIPDSSLGSAKKRWLRQAMCEDTEVTSATVPGDAAIPSPGPNNCSPSTPPLQGSEGEKCAVCPTDDRAACSGRADLVTPLKKRRLARESDAATPPSTPPQQTPALLTSSGSETCEAADSSSQLETPASAAPESITVVVKQESAPEPDPSPEETKDNAEAAGEPEVRVKEEACEGAEVKNEVDTECQRPQDVPVAPCKVEQTESVDSDAKPCEEEMNCSSSSVPSAKKEEDEEEESECARSVTPLPAVKEETAEDGKTASIDCDVDGEAETRAAEDTPPGPSPVKSPSMSAQTTPTKRKVSLLEYRKRKLEFQSSSSSPVSSACSTPLLMDFPANSPLQLTTLPLFATATSPEKVVDATGAKSDRLREPQEEVRWGRANDQQRENLTERLKREFGLVTDDESTAGDAADTEDAADIPPPPPPLPPPPPPSHPPPMATVYAARPQTSAKHGFPVFAYVACQVGSQFELPPPPPPPLPVGNLPRPPVVHQNQPRVRTVSRPLLPTPSSAFMVGQPVSVVENPNDPRPGGHRSGAAAVPPPPRYAHHHQPQATAAGLTTNSSGSHPGSNGMPRHPVQMQVPSASAKGYFAPNYFK